MALNVGMAYADHYGVDDPNDTGHGSRILALVTTEGFWAGSWASPWSTRCEKRVRY